MIQHGSTDRAEIAFPGRESDLTRMPYTKDPQESATFSPSSANQQPVMPSNKYEIEDWKWKVEHDLRAELGVPPRWETQELKIEFHRRQLAMLLDKANDSPRCAHVFADGRMCKAPRVKRGTLCYAHAQMEARSPKQLSLPPLEDANAVMIWIMEVSRSLLDGRISEKTAGLMFYGLQLAMVNAKQTTFKDTNPLEMVRTAPPVCRELKARKKMEARLAPDMEGKEDFAARALPEGLEAETDVEEADEAANPGVESAKSIFFGVEQCGGGVAEAGPSTSLRISPADSDARTSAQVESAKSIFFEVEVDRGGAATETGPSTSLRISPADSDARTSAQVESAKSIFSGVEADRGGAATQAGPSTSLRISPADSDAGSEFYVEEKKGAVYKPVGKPGVMLVHSGG